MNLKAWSGARTIPSLAILGLISLPIARANLVTNGTFTTSPTLGSNTVCTTNTSDYPSFGACTVSPWTGNFEVENGTAGYNIPTGGVGDTLILQTLSTASPTAIQSIDFLSTGTYVLTFGLADRPGDTTTQPVTVSLNGTTLPGGSDLTGSTSSWTLETITFTVSATGSESLEFAGATAGAGLDQSAFIDDVSLNAQSTVAEPASLLLIGTGLLAFAACLRRKAVV